MGKLKNYDCHKQKYYVPQTKPKWAVLNLKQAAKKVDKENKEREVTLPPTSLAWLVVPGAARKECGGQS